MADTAPGTRTPSKEIEQALVDAAERVLVRDGLAGVTVRAVATEAGVAPMGVYNRFGNKDGLVAAVLMNGFDGLAAAVTGHRSGGPLERLIAAGHAYRDYALAHPQHYEAMFGAGMSATERADEQLPELREHAGAAFGALLDDVRTAMDAGFLREDDHTETAQVIWSAVHGAVALELAGVVQTPNPAGSYDRLLRLIVAGLR